MTSWGFFRYLFNLSKTKNATDRKQSDYFKATHHWIVLRVPGCSLLRGLSNKMFLCFFFFLGGVGVEPAEPGPGENKAKWSRKCHFLTLSQGDLNQKESVRNTKRKESTLKGAEQLSVTFTIKGEASRCVTLFRNAERSSTLHVLLVDVGPGRTLAFCHVILNYGYDLLRMAINYP